MSTTYQCQPPLPWSRFWDALPEGITEGVNPELSGPDCRILTDGQNYLHSSPADDGDDTEFECYGLNNPHAIIRAIEEAFDVKIVSEHSEEFDWDRYESE